MCYEHPELSWWCCWSPVRQPTCRLSYLSNEYESSVQIYSLTLRFKARGMSNVVWELDKISIKIPHVVDLCLLYSFHFLIPMLLSLVCTVNLYVVVSYVVSYLCCICNLTPLRCLQVMAPLRTDTSSELGHKRLFSTFWLTHFAVHPQRKTE